MDAASAVPPEYALREIAKAQARRGDFDAARATASNLKSEKYRGEALQVIEHEERKAAGVLPFSWQAHWEQARTHPLSRYRFAAQFQLALEREKTGGWNAAKPLYEEAFVTAQTMTAALIRAESFALLLFATRDD